MKVDTAPSGRQPFANALFFPAATLHAAVILPLWVGGLVGAWSMPAGLDFPAGHAHEMLLGFAMAVVAGYLLGPQPMHVTLGLLTLWCIARVGFMTAPGSAIALLSTAMFAAGVVWRVVPRYALAAKQWRNRVVAPTVAALALTTLVIPTVLACPGCLRSHASMLFQVAVILLALLMFFMGGRILAGAVAGHMKSRRKVLNARVQPRLEGTVLLALIGALLLQPLPYGYAGMLTGGLLCAAGLLTALRMLRWRLWHCQDRPDLLALASGYAWLAIGLFAFGLAHLHQSVSSRLGLHCLTIGALGTLTLTVMARTRLLYRFRDAHAMSATYFTAVLMSLATLARISIEWSWSPMRFDVALAVAAALWSLACLGILPALLRSTTLTSQGRHGVKID